MKKVKLIILVLFSFQGLLHASSGLPADRWLEIDLYWFEQHDVQKSANEFWDRCAPLMEGITGWKGVILNVGWTGDYLFDWQGNLAQRIALPRNMTKYPWFKNNGMLSGNTKERNELWKSRFATAAKPEAISYEPWTYRDLAKLIKTLKTVASKKYGLKDIMVGTFVVGWKNIYGGEGSKFSKSHPEAFNSEDYYGHEFLNLEAKLLGDKTSYGAYPNGIPKGTPLTEFFGKQWGDLSKSLGMDAIVLRDSYLGVGIYGRTGPFGNRAPADPAKVESWSKATAELVKQTKISNKNALVIAYSNGASAVADWRVNCFDLEQIANDGYLDAWIDQTWAGAWNEVGQRPNNFWNVQPLGWTYQLNYMLLHGAILARSKVHHYFLTETYDAWESWDIIHGFPEHLKWGIWAFSHAGVKTPDGLKMPAGNYISWCNKGKELLSKDDVEFLRDNVNAAISDAYQTEDILGPTLVYNRSAMVWQNKNRPDESIKEWIDEQSGTFSKWSVPILSVTRSEYLPHVKSDMFLLQTPVHLAPGEKENILALITSGHPVGVFGSPANGIEPEIKELIGLDSKEKSISRKAYIGFLDGKTEGVFKNLPNTFPLYQPFTENEIKNAADLIYRVDDSPCLIENTSGRKQVIGWDPPEFSINYPFSQRNFGKPMDEIIGSATPFVLLARKINEILNTNHALNISGITQAHPVHVSGWALKNGDVKILTGNLEEGINHTPDKSSKIEIHLPGNIDKNGTEIIDEWYNQNYIIRGSELKVELGPAETKLFLIRK